MFDILVWVAFGSVLVMMVALSVGAVWFSRKPSSKVLLVAGAGGVTSLILVGCAAPTTEATNSTNNILVSRVEVSRYGFNNSSGDFHLEVEEGQKVEVTFVYKDDDLAENNTHIIASADYGINTGPLDRNNPEVTLSFIAKESGEVIFGCIAPGCTGHHNLHGEDTHDDDDHAEENEHTDEDEHADEDEH